MAKPKTSNTGLLAGYKSRVAVYTLLLLVVFACLVSLAMGAFSDTGDMQQAMQSSVIMSLTMTGIGVMLVWCCLRYLDWLAGFDFRRWVTAAREDDPYFAVYLGLRVLGFCLLVGLLLS